MAPLENLTPDEVLLFHRLSSGGSEAQIAQDLNRTESSIRKDIDLLLKKAGVCSRIELLLYAYSKAQKAA